MTSKSLLLLACLFAAASTQAQVQKQGAKKKAPAVRQQTPVSQPKKDTIPHPTKTVSTSLQSALYDTTFMDYDAIFSELDALIDSLYAPRSFAVLTAGTNNGYFTYSSKSGNDTTVTTIKRPMYNASVGYYSKTGLGISGGISVVNENGTLNPFQFSATGSYDFLNSHRFITGLAYTRFFTKENLGFYTSPLQNELYAYFTYRKLWVKPSVSASYGWGSRSSYETREEQIQIIKKKKILLATNTVQVNTVEQLADFNLTASLRHDFYFLHPFSQKDYFRVTPQVALISGTQQFGFNQMVNNSLQVGKGVGLGLISKEQPNSENVVLENTMRFRPLSLAANLTTEYVLDKIFLQPRVMFDYYFPAKENKLTSMFFLKAGLVF
jgi:hypothetical protein